MADVFEVVSVPIADGVTIEQMAAADTPVGTLVSTPPGLISRETGISVREDGLSPGNEWFGIMRWDTIENAQAVAQALNAASKVSGAMARSMRVDQLFFRHFEIS